MPQSAWTVRPAGRRRSARLRKAGGIRGFCDPRPLASYDLSLYFFAARVLAGEIRSVAAGVFPGGDLAWPVCEGTSGLVTLETGCLWGMGGIYI